MLRPVGPSSRVATAGGAATWGRPYTGSQIRAMDPMSSGRNGSVAPLVGASGARPRTVGQGSGERVVGTRASAARPYASKSERWTPCPAGGKADSPQSHEGHEEQRKGGRTGSRVGWPVDGEVGSTRETRNSTLSHSAYTLPSGPSVDSCMRDSRQIGQPRCPFSPKVKNNPM